MRVRLSIPRLAFSLLCCGMAACQRADNGRTMPAPAPPPPPAEAATHLTGTASCSGRSCHGGLEPRAGQEIGHDEYTTWLTHDKHASAFQSLFNERSKRIARNLGGAKQAHQDERCLSCHVTPYAAAAHADLAKEETAFGVGCESCHGAAGKWLSAHTEAKWKDLEPRQKRAEGMIPFRSLADLAEACVGCHVGAPPNQENHLPLPRDVNHDLIAAGHPRLNFELDVFLDNLPPHWNQQAKENRDGKNIHIKTWLHGQLASAQAALELLVHRAEEKNGRPWPEFAEYDCFACHHDLQANSWRQEPTYGAGRRPGSLPWGTWHFTMPRLLVAGLPAPDTNLLASLDALEKLMGRAAPSRTDVLKQTRAALVAIKKKRDAITSWDSDRQAAQAWLTAFGRDERLTNAPSWDAAMQLCLALQSLDPSPAQALRTLQTNLAFPRDFDSPRSFSPAHLKELLKRLPTGARP